MSLESQKQTLDSKGWIEIEQIFLDEFLEGKKPINLKTEGKSNEQIACEARSREYSAKAIKRVLSKLNRIKNPTEVKKESYK